ncbi:E3 ubiquitin-protein ligase RMA3-like isoform X2 [Solanum dulcamara]|nr:E3 ubiquitin-protein ligase RMA3-like isoform X2 [Solanum dulcamara]
MTIIRVGSDEDISVDKRNSVPFPTATSENETSCFDCNICLDSAHDPVVTLCGHLYCWSCIYKWLQVERSGGPGSVEKSKCPVCKAHISNSSLVPLYGRGISSLESEPKKAEVDVDIPHRPRAIGTITPRNSVSPIPRIHQRLRQTSLYPPRPSTFQHHQQYLPQALGSYAAMAPSSFGSTAMTSLFSPVVGVFGEMFSSRMFGIAYPHPRSYLIRGHSGLRMRREEIQVDKFLNRLSIFLFCCFILCLLLF